MYDRGSGLEYMDKCQEQLPGSAFIPNTGVSTEHLEDNEKGKDSESSASSEHGVAIISSWRQRVWAEAACSLTACLASLMIGIIVGFSSPTLTQLDSPEHLNQLIEAGSIYASVFGVSAKLSCII